MNQDKYEFEKSKDKFHILKNGVPLLTLGDLDDVLKILNAAPETARQLSEAQKEITHYKKWAAMISGYLRFL